jgi:hypothetical protein
MIWVHLCCMSSVPYRIHLKWMLLSAEVSEARSIVFIKCIIVQNDPGAAVLHEYAVDCWRPCMSYDTRVLDGFIGPSPLCVCAVIMYADPCCCSSCFLHS